MPYKDPEKNRAYSRQYNAANAAQISASRRQYRKANLEKMRAQSRESARASYARNRDRLREQKRRLRAADPSKFQAQKRRRMYGVDEEVFARLWQAQQGICVGCGDPFQGMSTRAVHVDHDHRCCPGRTSCGQCVRGLLCTRCNVGLGMLGDDPTVMRRLADYVDAHPPSPKRQLSFEVGQS